MDGTLLELDDKGHFHADHSFHVLSSDIKQFYPHICCNVLCNLDRNVVGMLLELVNIGCFCQLMNRFLFYDSKYFVSHDRRVPQVCLLLMKASLMKLPRGTFFMNLLVKMDVSLTPILL
jgi:hypothetical protein